MAGVGMGMAATDLGLGTSLAGQVDDLTEEEKRRRRMGLAQSPAVQALFGYGRAGVAPAAASSQLGLGGARGY